MEDIGHDLDTTSESIYDKTSNSIALTSLRTPKAASTFDLSYSANTSQDDVSSNGKMIARIYNGCEDCLFSRSIPDVLLPYIHPETFAIQMDELNETLQHAMNRNYGLFDNLMTNLTFQLWPLIFGTNYRRCMKRFAAQLDRFEEQFILPHGFKLIPPKNTAFMCIEIVPTADSVS